LPTILSHAKTERRIKAIEILNRQNEYGIYNRCISIDGFCYANGNAGSASRSSTSLTAANQWTATKRRHS
jgi:hypothetical protein